jgi:hypothetical protein
MIIGAAFCNWAKTKLDESKAALSEKQEEARGRENFADEADMNKRKDVIEGMQHGLVFTIYMISVAFFLMELILMFYALKLSLRCSKPGMNRVAHVSMAFFFTFPYILMSLFFSNCEAL